MNLQVLKNKKGYLSQNLNINNKEYEVCQYKTRK
jgi:hypothetical protein